MNPLRFLFARRALLPSLAIVGAVATGAIHASPTSSLGSIGIAAASLALAILAAYREGRVGWSIFGGALALASLTGTGTDVPEYAWIDAAGYVGGAVATAATVVSIARAPSAPSLAPSHPGSGRALAVFAALPWLGGAASWIWPSVPLMQPIAPAVALAMLTLHSVLARAQRRLELEAEARLGAATAIGVMASIVCAACLVAAAGDLAHVGRVVAPAACVAITLATTLGDPLSIARTVRRIAVLGASGGGAALVLAIFAIDSPRHAAIVVLVAVAVALALGAKASSLEAAFLPESRVLVDRLEKAAKALLYDEPDQALLAALSELRLPDPGAAQPELYSIAPPRCAWVDAAGYLHEREAELPPELVRQAAREPFGVLRTDVLEELEVRRADLRSLLQWMRDARALAAVVIVRAGEIEGALVLPRGSRRKPPTLEEAHGLKALADALAMATSAKSSIERSLLREREATARAEAESDRGAGLDHALSLQQEHNRRATDRLARPAAIGIYSAPSRLAYDAALRRTKAQAPLFIVAPSGVDPVPYLARAHLAGPRGMAPLVLVDGTSAREHDVARWREPKVSPLALSNHGMLVLLDGAALPVEAQRLIAQALAERRFPWEGAEQLDVVLAVSATSAGGDRLDPALVNRLGDAIEAPIELPRLRDRAEDLRAIVNDRLAREGLRVRGTPVGIEAAAFGRLVEHPFLGEDAELAAIVQRLVATTHGDVIQVSDVEGLGIFAPNGELGVTVQARKRG